MTGNSSVVVPLMHSCSNPPLPGVIVRLFLDDGNERRGSYKIVEEGGRRDLQWYDAGSRKTIEAATIKGWMPAIYRSVGLSEVQKRYGVPSNELREAVRPLFYLMEAYGIETFSIDKSSGQPVIHIGSEVIR